MMLLVVRLLGDPLMLAVLYWATQVKLPHEILYVLIVVNVVFPVASIFVGWRIEIVRRRRAKKDGTFHVTDMYKKPENSLVTKQRRLIERDINENTLRLLVSWSSIVVIFSCLGGGVICMGIFAKQAVARARTP